MELQITPKGALYVAECRACGADLETHEWAHGDHNQRRDAMEAGRLRCDDCGGQVDPDTFKLAGRYYAARYSMPGYLDCTDWHFGRNKRELLREVRDLYGD